MSLTIINLKGNRKKTYALYKSYIDKENKKQVKKYIQSFATKEEAEIHKIAYSSNKIDMLKTNSNTKKSLTFKDVYHLWLKEKEVKDSTLKNINTYFKRSHKLHEFEMKDITGALLNDIFREFNLSKGSLRNMKSFWKEIWDYAILNDYAEKNYPSYLKIPQQEKGKKTSNRNRIISEDELKILWNNLNKDKRNIVDMVLILTYTGLRISELLNLKISNIHLEDNYIDVKKSKTEAGIHKVAIADKIKPLLEKRIEERKQDILLESNIVNINAPLFKTQSGKIYKYDSFDNHFRLLFRELGLSYHTIHDTRHTFASMISDKEINPEIITKMIGHKNYRITSNTYIHKNMGQMQQAVNLL